MGFRFSFVVYLGYAYFGEEVLTFLALEVPMWYLEWIAFCAFVLAPLEIWGVPWFKKNFITQAPRHQAKPTV